MATASRAMTQRGYASAAARKRVLEAAHRLGYTPSRWARALRGVRRPAIGVVLPDLGIPVYVKWLRAAEEAARRHGYILLICDTRRSADAARTQLRWLLEERVAGLLVAGYIGAEGMLATFRDAGIPVVPNVARPRLRKSPRHDAEFPATLQAFRHVVALGHRRIGYVTIGRRDEERTAPLPALRLSCLDQALDEVGERQDPRLVMHLDRADDCRDEVGRLVRGQRRPTALVAGTGELTAPILLALGDAGLSIPGDVSLLAFGESDWEVAYRPPISVVRHDYAGIGAAAADYLIARIEGRKDPAKIPPFPSEFVDRGSIGPPPRAPRRQPGHDPRRPREDDVR